MHCQVPHQGKDCGDDVAGWLDDLLGTYGNRLVLKDSSLTHTRTVHNSTLKYVAWTKMAKDEDEVGYIHTIYKFIGLSMFCRAQFVLHSV